MSVIPFEKSFASNSKSQCWDFNKNELRYRAPNQDLLLNRDTTGIMVRCI